MSPSTLSPISQCSQELIDKIIDFVEEMSPSYLFECALVCHSFHSRSQYHILRTLNIKSEGRERRMKTAMDIIHQNPSFSPLFRELDLHMLQPQYDYNWIGQDPTFLDLMNQKKLSDTKLSKLSLRASVDFLWHTLSITIHPIIDSLFRPFIYPFLTSLVLENVDLKCTPAEFFTECVKLVELKLDNAGFIGVSYEATIRSPVKPTIHQLSHCMSRPPLSGDELVKGWDECLDFSNLRCLDIYKCGLPDLIFEQNFVDIAGASLQILRIMSRDEDAMLTSVEDPGFRNCNHFIDLQNAVNLTTLHTTILFPEEELDPFIRTLSQIPSANKLTEIDLVIYVGVYTPAKPNALLNADWTTFSDELSRITSSHPVDFRFKMIYIHHDVPGGQNFLREDPYRQCNLSLTILRAHCLYPMTRECQCRIFTTYEVEVILEELN